MTAIKLQLPGKMYRSEERKTPELLIHVVHFIKILGTKENIAVNIRRKLPAVDLTRRHEKETSRRNIIFMKIYFVKSFTLGKKNSSIKIVPVRLFQMPVTDNQMVFQGAEIEI